MAMALPRAGGMKLQQRSAASRPAPGVLSKSARCPLKAPKAAAIAIPTDMTLVSDEARAKLATELGFRQIGKELPDEVTLNDIVKTLPKEVFELDHGKAWTAVLTSIVSMSACLYIISISPWYMLPFAWALAGTAFTGFFVVGHDAGHRSFHKNNLVEDIVGTLMFAPLIYPFEPWRIKHNHHHAHTNKLEEDTAWVPIEEEKMAQWDSTASSLFKFFLGTPVKLWASVGHWAIWHFDLNKYTEKQRPRVLVSLAAVAAFVLIGMPAIVHFTGFAGLAKYWLMPWLGYHFWMSTFTVIHHTAPHIPFRPAAVWNAAKAQLSGTVHCDFPAWVEFLTHDISVHVPHHVSSKIPWYNLRKAHASLLENWGPYMALCDFNWRVVKNAVLECHLYDKETYGYKAFDWKKEEALFAFQRKVMPNTM